MIDKGLKNVIVIAGTSDSRELIGRLLKMNIKVIATVTTKFGSELLGEHENLVISEGKLSPEAMEKLIREVKAGCLVDASHPFAREVSINAIGACKNAGIPYIRFERKETEVGEFTEGKPENMEAFKITRVKSFEEAAETANILEGNIFLTTGSNSLELFASKINDYKSRLFVRVLPDSNVIAKCESLGLTANNIFALKGPFNEEMNVEMLKHCNAGVLVTKDSGNAGGAEEKISAARRLGLQIIFIERPEVVYPIKVSSFKEVEEFVAKAF